MAAAESLILGQLIPTGTTAAQIIQIALLVVAVLTLRSVAIGTKQLTDWHSPREIDGRLVFTWQGRDQMEQLIEKQNEILRSISEVLRHQTDIIEKMRDDQKTMLDSLRAIERARRAREYGDD